MAGTSAFDWVCGELETRSSLDRLEARGTVRLALREAGLDAASVTPEQMGVVLEKLLVGELEVRGLANAADLCRSLADGLSAAALSAPAGGDTPEAIFRRLAGAS